MAQGKAEYYLEDSVLTFYIGHTRIKVLSFNKVGSGKNIYSRTHAKNHYELHYVLKGDGMIDVGDEKYALKRGTLYVTGPGLIYRKSGGKNDSVYEYEMTLRIEEDGCEGELSKILSSKSFFLCEGLTDCEICFRSAERELIEHNGFYMESIENNLKQIIIMLLRKYGVSMPYIPLPKAEKEDKCCLITDMEFIFNIREPAQRDSYFYATYRLPMAMTYGRTEVRFQIYHGGDANAYSANGMNEAYEYSRQLYKLVTHTDTRYKKMADDKDGTTKRYDLGAVLEGTNSYSHGSWENWKNVHYVKCIGSNSENQKGIRAMAMSYNREWSNHYQDPEIVDRCVAWLDYQVRSQGSNGGWNNETYKTWIGGPDRMEANGGINAGARAVGEVYTELADAIEAGGYLDEYIDDDLNPNTPMVTRKKAYINMYVKASDYMFNVIQRKPAVNQELFNVVSGVAYQMALKRLSPESCMSDEALKQRMYEATGVVASPRGSILISPKGLSMETVGHLDGAYDGNYGPHGAAMVADLAYMTGDEELIKKAINASHAMNYFADTIVNSKGFNALRRDYNINTRNYKGPGIVEYAAWNNFIEAGFGSKDSVRSMELKAGRNTLILTDKEIPNTYLINVKNISFEKID